MEYVDPGTNKVRQWFMRHTVPTTHVPHTNHHAPTILYTNHTHPSHPPTTHTHLPPNKAGEKIRDALFFLWRKDQQRQRSRAFEAGTFTSLRRYVVTSLRRVVTLVHMMSSRPLEGKAHHTTSDATLSLVKRGPYRI